MRQLLEGDLPSSIYTQQHCSVKGEFCYFGDGCFTDRPSLVNSPATGGRQFKKQHQVQKAEDGAVDVAVDVLQESDEIHRVDFLVQLKHSKLNRSGVAIAFKFLR
jgi:hypothetical protein